MTTSVYSGPIRKRFGQHFLRDQGAIEQIVEAIKPLRRDAMVEIGPGDGALTARLLARLDRLEAIEIDRGLAAHLQRRFAAHAGFRVHLTDALQFDFRSLAPPQSALRVVGNLPYNISTPLLFHLLTFHGAIQDMTFMLQLEVANRLIAGPGDKSNGRLGVMVQYHCHAEKLFEVSAAAFHPRPKVASAVMRLQAHAVPPFPARDLKALDLVTRTAFSRRRKTIRKGLQALLSEAQLESLGIDGELRPQDLSVAEYVKISNHLSDAPR